MPDSDGPEYTDRHDSAFKLASQLGLAMLMWKYVEIDMFKLFRHLVSPNDHDQSVILWHSIYGITRQYATLNALAELRFRTDQRTAKRWQALSGRIKRAIRQRNDLTHFSIQDQPDFSLIPNVTDPNYWQNAGFSGFEKKCKSSDVGKTARIYANLLSDMNKLMIDLGVEDFPTSGTYVKR